MPDKSKSVTYSAATRAQAEQMIAKLKSENFSGNDISMDFPDRAAFKNAPPETKKKNKFAGRFGALASILVCGLIGLILGRLAWAGVLQIPGIAVDLVAGPMMATLGGAVIGALVGGIGWWLVIFSLPDDGSQYTHGNVVTGNIIVSVRTDDTEKFTRAKNVINKPVSATNSPEQKT